MRKALLFYSMILLGMSLGNAQISFEAIPQKREVGLNEPIRIQFLLTIKNVDIQSSSSAIKLPGFTNSQVVGRNVIQRQGFENDEMVILYGEEITLRAVKSGNIRIGAASVVVNGKTHMTKPFTIRVAEDDVENQEDRISVTGIGDAFLVFKVSDKNPYQNEGVTARLKFYTKRVELLNSLTNLNPPNFQGLFVQPVKERNNTYEQEIINGEVYLSRVIGTYVLFPSKPGVMTINPFTLTMTVSNGFFDEQEIYVKSAPVTLQVRKIPENAPKDFYGVVGEYKIRAVTNKEHLKTDEAATVTVEISGRGNIGLLKSPELIVPQGIEKFTPKNHMESIPSSEGVLGKVSTSTVLVPHAGGKYDIQVKSFSYFNPKEEEFKTLSVNPVVLRVKRDSVSVKKDSSGIRSTRDTGKIESYIPDFHVKETITDVLEGKEKKSGKTIAVLVVVTGVLTLAVIYFGFIRKRKSRQEETEEDSEQLSENKSKFEKLQSLQETPSDKKYFTSDLFQLKKIAERGEDKKGFYSLAESVLQSAINQSLNISRNQFITSSDVEEKLANKFGDEFAEECKDMLLKCQIEQYSNLSAQDSLDTVYFKIEELLKSLV